VNVYPPANVALLIFPVYSAAGFRKSLYSFPLAHLDAQRNSLLSFGKEDDCICVCSKCPNPNLLV
jgi:hypothetical protein